MHRPLLHNKHEDDWSDVSTDISDDEEKQNPDVIPDLEPQRCCRDCLWYFVFGVTCTNMVLFIGLALLFIAGLEGVFVRLLGF